MKKILLIFCALCFTQVAFAALDRDYFDYSESPEFQSIPVDETAAKYAAGEGQTETVTVTRKVVKQDKGGKKRIRLRNEGSSWINTYWNFGQPNYGETGRF